MSVTGAITTLLCQLSWLDGLRDPKPPQIRLANALRFAIELAEVKHPVAFDVAVENERRHRERLALEHDSNLDLID